MVVPWRLSLQNPPHIERRNSISTPAVGRRESIARFMHQCAGDHQAAFHPTGEHPRTLTTLLFPQTSCLNTFRYVKPPL